LNRRALPEWDRETLCAGDFDALYPIATEILRAAATREASEAHPDIYNEASIVSKAFCDELNELFQCSGEEVFDFIPIKPYTQMLVDAGLANVMPGPDGKPMVSLTEQGKAAAAEVDQAIKSRLN